MDPVRNYYHVITNNDGDSIITLSDKDLAFNTENFIDGSYRIFVQAFDPNENYAIDSMDVYFKNGITSVKSNDDSKINSFMLEQNYPNPFNPVTKISWQSPVSSWQILKIFDVLGNEIITLTNGFKPAGSYEVEFDASSLNSGVYFYQLTAVNPSSGSGMNFTQTRKMLFIK